MTITATFHGNLIELSENSKALSDTVRHVLEPHLTYTYKQWLRGYAQIDPLTGDRTQFQLEIRKLYRYDSLGRMCVGKGLWKKVSTIFNDRHIPVKIIKYDIKDNRVYETDWDAVVDNFTFRSQEQEDCLLMIASNDCGIIKAPTGFGKSELIKRIRLLYPYAKMDIVTPSLSLVNDMVAALTKITPSVGKLGGGSKTTGLTTVISADSLHLAAGDADILIGDEVHSLAAPSYAVELVRYKNSRNFGFSASPKGRADGLDASLEQVFGPVIFEVKYGRAVDTSVVVPIKVEWLNVIMQDNPVIGRKTDVSKKRWGIWKNEYRNQVIAEKVKTYDDNTQVLILVDTIEHALYLRKYLTNFKLCYAPNGIKEDKLEEYRRKKLFGEAEPVMTRTALTKLLEDICSGKEKKVIGLQRMLGTGKDMVHLEILVRADAASSSTRSIQFPGRVSRIATDKTHGILIDCMDQFDEGFRRKALTRKRHYTKEGWEQIFPSN